MNSSIIHKIAKAQHYALEPERVTIDCLHVQFRGTNQVHRVAFDNGTWSCDCDFFGAWQACSHTMALQRMLAPMEAGTIPTDEGIPGRN